MIKRKTAYKIAIEAIEKELAIIGGDAHIESLYPGAFIFAERMAKETERKREAIGILREEMESM
jgi:hypothetical protein